MSAAITPSLNDDGTDHGRPTRAAAAIAAVAAGALAWLGFSSGGFFPDTTALASLALIALLAVFVSVARAPGSALRPRLVMAVVALAAFASWQLASGGWSDAPGRATLAFNLTLLYVLVLVACGLIVDRPARVRALVYGIAVGLFVLCLAGLLSRTLPDLFPVQPGPGGDERLNFPLSYWNAMGISGAVATIFCVGLTSSGAERPLVRVLAAAAVPALATTVYFTFSRGSMAAGAAGLVLMAVLAPRRQLLTGLAAVVPPTVVAVGVAYGADTLARPNPVGEAAVSEGRGVILAVAAAMLAAGVIRATLARVVDPRLDSVRPTPRPALLATAAAVLLGSVVAFFALSGPERVGAVYDRFVEGAEIDATDQRERLTDPGNNGRLAHWRVALEQFHHDEVKGAGAGTYQVWWNQLRDREFDVLNAHSLYLEVLGETGVVGLALLALALLAVLAAVLARLRGPERALWAAAAGAMVAWALEAGVDWTWQMPTTTAWVFALGGAALAQPPRADPAPAGPGRSARLVGGVAILVVAVTPAKVLLAQRDLNKSIAALREGDCQTTVNAALSSAQMLPVRADPYALLAYCDARLGLGPLALQMVGRAIERDPRNWEFRYDQALVLAVQRRDPRPALRVANRLNPLENRIDDLQEAVQGRDPEKWRRGALRAPLLLPVQ